MINLGRKKSLKKNSKRVLSIRKIINSYISYSFAVFFGYSEMEDFEKNKNTDIFKAVNNKKNKGGKI